MKDDSFTHTLSLSVFIQAGGHSSRMGCNKALLPLGSQTCIERVLAVAMQISPSVTIVANDANSYRFLNCPLISDTYRGIGPLGGIHAALQHCQADWALILGCDLPFLTAPLLRYLIAQANDFDAIVPRSEDGRLQPLCALYARRCLSEVIRLIESKELAPRALFPRVRTRVVQWRELSSLPGAQWFFFDMNTPDSYERAKALCQ
ncbi:MAG: molybdenum cofactor guanylyltransferase [Acidobacteriota bacterium]|nr:molybdenum cofactor guanylyltransferase [Blastocatellia bacterium]MDW8238849.1 molybdenum cofactor guanylyltransferase [Acidobacteriota bacterium]